MILINGDRIKLIKLTDEEIEIIVIGGVKNNIYSKTDTETEGIPVIEITKQPEPENFLNKLSKTIKEGSLIKMVSSRDYYKEIINKNKNNNNSGYVRRKSSTPWWMK